jgi:hypothetical protein
LHIPSLQLLVLYTLKKVNDFPELFLSRESLVSDIPAGTGKMANLFLQCTIICKCFSVEPGAGVLALQIEDLRVVVLREKNLFYFVSSVER